MGKFGGPEFLFLLAGVKWTLLLTLIAFAGGGVIGLLVALARTSPWVWLRSVTAGYIALFQSTPLLMQLFVIYYGIALLLLKLALQMARDDYEDRRERQRQGVELAKRAGKYAGRQADTTTHERIIALRSGGRSIAETAKLAGCSESQVKRVWSMRADVPA